MRDTTQISAVPKTELLGKVLKITDVRDITTKFGANKVYTAKDKDENEVVFFGTPVLNDLQIVEGDAIILYERTSKTGRKYITAIPGAQRKL
jgi:hypothetical protein